MKIDNRIIEEISKFNKINKYISEQEATIPPPTVDAGAIPPPPADAGAIPPPPVAGAVPPPPATGPTPVDVENDPDVEKIGDEKKKGKEIEVTDLVKSQKSVEKKQEEYFDNLFKHLTDLEEKLTNMDSIMDKLNSIETKIEKYRQKSPQEKLELRTLDSGPFNQKLSDFFEDKQEDFEKTGKDEYILTKDEVENYSPIEIKKSFREFDDLGPDTDNFKKIT